MKLYSFILAFLVSTYSLGTVACTTSDLYDFGRLKFPIPSECIYEQSLVLEHLEFLESIGVDLGSSLDGHSQISKNLIWANNWGSSWYNSNIFWEERFPKIQKVIANSKLQLNIPTGLSSTLLNDLIAFTPIDDDPIARERLFIILNTFSLPHISFDWNLLNGNKHNVLFYVVSKYDSSNTLDLFNYFLNRGVYSNQIDLNGRNIFFHLSRTNPELVAAISSKGIDLNKYDSHGYTPLLYQVEYFCREDGETFDRNLDLIKEMVKHGANIYSKTKEGLTAKDLAIKNRCPGIITFFEQLPKY